MSYIFHNVFEIICANSFFYTIFIPKAAREKVKLHLIWLTLIYILICKHCTAEEHNYVFFFQGSSIWEGYREFETDILESLEVSIQQNVKPVALGVYTTVQCLLDFISMMEISFRNFELKMFCECFLNSHLKNPQTYLGDVGLCWKRNTVEQWCSTGNERKREFLGQFFSQKLNLT